MSPAARWTLGARRAVFDDGVRAAAIAVEDGRIARIGPWSADARYDHDAGDWLVFPGLVDAHVHANEPGRTDWEGLATATRAAAAGGVTTIVDMPLNSLPPTTTLAALRAKQDAARGQMQVDVAFWAGAVPGNVDDFAPLVEAGVCGFKAFTCDSGVPEFPGLGPADLARALTRCAELGATLLVHAEDPRVLAAAPSGGSGRSYASWLASRPQAAEVEAIRALVGHLRDARARGVAARAHVVHLSAADALPIVRAAQAEGLLLSAETCPHYLALAAEEIADGATLCKCAPPVRAAENRERLWQGLDDGTIALVASDHSPSPPAGKDLAGGDFTKAWGGISSLGLGLPVLWGECARRGVPPERLARWMALAPARLAGLDDAKGSLAAGKDADFCLFDPAAAWTIAAESLWTRHRISPYVGRSVAGGVMETWLRGERVFAAGAMDGPPRGRLLARPRRPQATHPQGARWPGGTAR